MASGESADAQRAARLVTRTQHAASNYDFTGTATVTWQTGDGTRHDRVQVHDTSGSVEIRSRDGVVIDDGRHTYVRDRRGTPAWTGMFVEPIANDPPPPGSHWALSTKAGPTVAGRPTTAVLATRPDGTPALRLSVDDETGLLLGRAVLGRKGEVERSVAFDTIEIGPTGAVDAPRHVDTEQAQPLRSVPSGYRAPASLAGFDLVTRSRHPDGVLLFYSDGIFSASVFEQPGELNWSALPAGGTTRDLAGTRARAYRDPSGNVLVWERDGLVYTCVSDAPTDVFTNVVDGIAGAGPSTPESIVDYVLGPFGWS